MATTIGDRRLTKKAEGSSLRDGVYSSQVIVRIWNRSKTESTTMTNRARRDRAIPPGSALAMGAYQQDFLSSARQQGELCQERNQPAARSA